MTLLVWTNQLTNYITNFKIFGYSSLPLKTLGNILNKESPSCFNFNKKHVFFAELNAHSYEYVYGYLSFNCYYSRPLSLSFFLSPSLSLYLFLFLIYMCPFVYYMIKNIFATNKRNRPRFLLKKIIILLNCLTLKNRIKKQQSNLYTTRGRDSAN